MRRTLFSLLLTDRDLLGWEAFCVHFAATGRDLARETGNRRLATASVGRTTFDRWSSGTWSGRPRGEAAQILERMLGHCVEELFNLAPVASEPTAPLQFTCEIPIVEVVGDDDGPALTRRRSADLYDVPLLGFGKSS
ncbi:hypothetical protein [Streptomyces mutabilis]|uniref:Uncharacterized protein n=1 Tax=Streptomyces mutabilis TaxID=67332 RepID=A0A086MR76_9ACTN|nr:hypothetical protein [Streptomyces mutabilis]KFG71394.1 hypothetical protein FM21_34455 [Streptomyces mutabilis]